MITPLLEKAILTGEAYYTKYTHAMGMFSKFTVPNGKLCIIVDIKWHQFNNPVTNDNTLTWDLFRKFNEYQLKIDSKKSTNFLTYRNTIDIVKTAVNPPVYDFLLSGTVLASLPYIWFTSGPPIIQDVFFICEEFLKITVSRNAYLHSLGANSGNVASPANEVIAPNGVKDVTLLKRLTMTTPAGNIMYYTPPNNEGAGLTPPAGGRNTESYRQDIDRALGVIYPPDAGLTATINTVSVTQPLVEFGIVIIDTNYFNNLMSS